MSIQLMKLMFEGAPQRSKRLSLDSLQSAMYYMVNDGGFHVAAYPEFTKRAPLNVLRHRHDESI